MSEPIKDFKAGQRSLSASHLNAVKRAAARQVVTVAPLEVRQTESAWILSMRDITDWWVGQIESSDTGGADDFSDARYFVRPLKATNTHTDRSDVILSPDTFPSDAIYTVTNLSESDSDTHTVPAGTKVIVFTLNDEHAPPNERYVMTTSGGIAGDKNRISDLRVSDLKLQMLVIKDVYTGGVLIESSDMGWQTWHTGSDCE